MKYYLHSVDTMDDEKIAELYQNFGYEGTGLFHAILEKIAKQEKPIKTEVLKKQLGVGKKLEKVWKFMETIELISSNNGDTFNEQLLNFSEKYKIKSEKNAKRISEWREKQKDIKNVTHYEQVCNTPKVKESKVNEIEIKEKENKEKEIKENKLFMVGDYISKFNEVRNTKFRNLSDKEQSVFLKTLKDYTVEEMILAYKNAITDPHHIDSGFKYLTPEFFTRPNNVGKFLSYTGSNKSGYGVHNRNADAIRSLFNEETQMIDSGNKQNQLTDGN